MNHRTPAELFRARLAGMSRPQLEDALRCLRDRDPDAVERALEHAADPLGGPHGRAALPDLGHVLPRCECGHSDEAHWEIAEPDGPRTGCSHLGCTCAKYRPVRDALRAAVTGLALPAEDVTAGDFGPTIADHDDTVRVLMQARGLVADERRQP